MSDYQDKSSLPRVPKVNEWPASERPRERLLRHGSEALSDAQLLAILLRTGSSDKGVLDLAISLLDTFKDLRNIDNASVSDLSQIKGVGTAKIAQIKAAFELGKRLMAESDEGLPLFNSSLAVYSYFAPRFKNMKKELFLCLLLDTKNRLIKDVRISEGTLTNSLIHPREAFKSAIKESAASVIFVHNHPSGDPTPSRDDIAVTERLKKAGEVIGIAALDHIIIGDGTFVSLKEKGLL
ncbi:MAG TPA: DNA repair protein RadC [Dissulfurispiraceae bacterium]|nr:DNA repair protein RadC [Dissulfurispiraceae bacterium]